MWSRIDGDFGELTEAQGVRFSGEVTLPQRLLFMMRWHKPHSFAGHEERVAISGGRSMEPWKIHREMHYIMDRLRRHGCHQR